MDLIKTISDLIALSALTAPKARGQDFVEIKVITDPEVIEKLASDLSDLSTETGKKGFERDSKNIRISQAVILLAVHGTKTAGLNCGACGNPKCSQLESSEGPEFAGPLCAWRLIDLGIALGSAVKTASIHNIDNRIMYSAGVAARKSGLIDGEIVVAVPVSATAKNIYFDR